MSFPKISLHPKLAAVLDILAGATMILWLDNVSAWWGLILWYAARLAIWAVLLRLSYYPKELKRMKHFGALAFFGLGLPLLMIFIDWVWAWRLLAAIFVIFPAAGFWLLPADELQLALVAKSYRRWLFLTGAFGLAGIWSGFFAFFTFQIIARGWFWPTALLMAVVTAFLSWRWWRDYGLTANRRLAEAAAVSLLIILELAWAIWQWPLGFIASGLLIVWLWYILWLMLRFHLTSEGIVWRKQSFFLAFNFILLALFFFVVSWR